MTAPGRCSAWPWLMAVSDDLPSADAGRIGALAPKCQGGAPRAVPDRSRLRWDLRPSRSGRSPSRQRRSCRHLVSLDVTRDNTAVGRIASMPGTARSSPSFDWGARPAGPPELGMPVPAPVSKLSEEGSQRMLEGVAQRCKPLGCSGAVEDPVVDREGQVHHGAHDDLAVLTTGRAVAGPTARITAWGGLITASQRSMPYMPRLLIVKVPPLISSTESFRSRAFSARSWARLAMLCSRSGARR